MLASVDGRREHPVRLVGDAHDLRRSRLTVFFRLPLAIPHLVWLAALGDRRRRRRDRQLVRDAVPRTPPRGVPPLPRARTSATRCTSTRSSTLAANPFPGFVGDAGQLSARPRAAGEPQRQSRWKTCFRIFLAIPAFVVDSALGGALFVAAVLHVVRRARHAARAPWGLRNLSAYALRYLAQMNAYLYLLTDAYPHASPLEGEDAPSSDVRRRSCAPRRARRVARARRGLGGRRLAALALERARVQLPHLDERALFPARALARGARATARSRGCFWLGHDAHAARRARPLRALRRPLDARVGRRAGRHRDAARDDRLRARLGGGAAVRGARRLVAAPLRARTGATWRRRSGTGSRSAPSSSCSASRSRS